ncbi:MAG: hypothetical protein RLZZ453_1223 [Chlamydiota bacterium]|jgi:protein phosphatase 2C family protein 2/3
MLPIANGTGVTPVTLPNPGTNTIAERTSAIYHLNGTAYYPVEERPCECLDRYIRGLDTIESRLNKAWDRAQQQATSEQEKRLVDLCHIYDLEPPPTLSVIPQEHLEGKTTICGYNVGFCSFQGSREYMEDELLTTSIHITVQDKEIEIPLFGVFDGHGGRTVARYLKDNLPRILTKAIHTVCRSGLTQHNIWNALKIIFVQANEEYKKQSTPKDYSGSTAIISIVVDGKLWTANLGDSRAILNNGWQLSTDAKPSDPNFAKGIKKRGGTLVETSKGISIKGGVDRNRKLAPARAINNEFPGVCTRSKVTCCAIPKNAVLFLGSDGIFEIASTKEVVKYMKTHFATSMEDLAKALVHTCYNKMVETPQTRVDNLTGIFVRLYQA